MCKGRWQYDALPTSNFLDSIWPRRGVSAAHVHSMLPAHSFAADVAAVATAVASRLSLLLLLLLLMLVLLC